MKCPIVLYRPLAAVAAFLTVAGAPFAAAEPRPASRPNIILMMADDMGWGDPGFNGNPLVAASINAEIAAVHDYLNEAVPGLVRGRSYRDTVNLFTRYNFREGRLKGITVGGGMHYRSPAALNSQMNNGVVTTLWGSIFTEYEAMAAYGFRLGAKVRGRLQLNIRNLLDRQRYEEINLSQTRHEAPRSYSLTTTLSF